MADVGVGSGGVREVLGVLVVIMFAVLIVPNVAVCSSLANS